MYHINITDSFCFPLNLQKAKSIIFISFNSYFSELSQPSSLILRYSMAILAQLSKALLQSFKSQHGQICHSNTPLLVPIYILVVLLLLWWHIMIESKYCRKGVISLKLQGSCLSVRKVRARAKAGQESEDTSDALILDKGCFQEFLILFLIDLNPQMALPINPQLAGPSTFNQ